MKKIAVIFGGRSTEHDVSIVTAISSVIKPLEASKRFEVHAVYISRDGVWYCDNKLKDISFFQSKTAESDLKKLKPITIDISHGFTIVRSGTIVKNKRDIKFDVIFPSMHGTHGEGGELMGLLQLANVPFVGCDMASSVIAMDKVLSKQVVTSNSSVNVSKYQYITTEAFNSNPDNVTSALLETLKLPLFVKPAHLGSSIGITRVTSKGHLRNAIEVACHYDDKVIIEEAVDNLIEVTLPVMGNDEMKPALLERPIINSEDFFGFETKYMQGGKKGQKGSRNGSQGYSELPAELPKKLYDRAVRVGLDVYKSVGCTGTARIDMLIDSKKEVVYFNEINPLPGSLYAHNWRRAGVSNIDLVTSLIDLAEERWLKNQHKISSFETNFLRQF